MLTGVGKTLSAKPDIVVKKHGEGCAPSLELTSEECDDLLKGHESIVLEVTSGPSMCSHVLQATCLILSVILPSLQLSQAIAFSVFDL